MKRPLALAFAGGLLIMEVIRPLLIMEVICPLLVIMEAIRPLFLLSLPTIN